MAAKTPRQAYAAERARQLAAQARRRPADPQQTPARHDPRAVVAALMVPCSTQPEPGRDPWRICGHPALFHDGPCTVTTAAGRCGCRKHTPGGHDYGPANSDLACRRCELHMLDIAGPCEPR